jgi:hypothetical protein
MTPAEKAVIAAAVNEVRAYARYDRGTLTYDGYLNVYAKMYSAVSRLLRERKGAKK